MRFADQVDARLTAAGALLLAAASLGALALWPAPAILIGGASISFGLTVGNVTTLQPIIVRREFGAESFGAVSELPHAAFNL